MSAPPPRLLAVLQAGQQHAARTGVRGNTPATAKADKPQPKSIDPRNPTGAGTAAKTPAAKPAMAPDGVAWIKTDVAELATKRAKHLAELAKVRREAQQCVKDEDAAEDKYASTSLEEADALIQTLAEQLKQKIAAYDKVQAEFEKLSKAGADAKGESAKALEAAQAALAAEKAEKEAEVKRLNGELQACEDNAAAAKKALETKAASDLQDLKAEMAKKLGEAKEKIEAQAKEIAKLTKEKGESGEKAQAELQKLKDKNGEMEALYKKVCALLECKK